MAGEQVWSVEPLSTAADRRCRPRQRLTQSRPLRCSSSGRVPPTRRSCSTTRPRRLVVEICRRLDGIPLAIELAAARTRAIGVAEIARRLDERFALLKAMRRGSDPRHRAMHDAISWSYDLLEPDEQAAVHCALGVRGLVRPAMPRKRSVHGGDVLDLLTRLTERSMLSVRPQAGGGDALRAARDAARLRPHAARRRRSGRAVHRPRLALRGGSRVRGDGAAGPDEARGDDTRGIVVRRLACRATFCTRDRRARRRIRAHRGDPRVRDARHALRGVRVGRGRLPRPGRVGAPLGAAVDRDPRVRRVGPRRVRSGDRTRRRDPPPRTCVVGRADRPRRAGARQRLLHDRPRRPRPRASRPTAQTRGGVRQRFTTRARLLHGLGRAQLGRQDRGSTAPGPRARTSTPNDPKPDGSRVGGGRPTASRAGTTPTRCARSSTPTASPGAPATAG